MFSFQSLRLSPWLISYTPRASPSSGDPDHLHDPSLLILHLQPLFLLHVVVSDQMKQAVRNQKSIFSFLAVSVLFCLLRHTLGIDNDIPKHQFS